MIFGGSIKRTQQTVSEAELGLLIELAAQSLLVLSLFFHIAERGTAGNFSWCSSLISPADLHLWL